MAVEHPPGAGGLVVGELAFVGGWVHRSNLVQAQQALGRWAVPEAGEWDLSTITQLLRDLKPTAEGAIRALAASDRRGRWVTSRELASELDIESPDLAGAISSIGKAAAQRGLESPIRSSLRRGPDGKPARHLQLPSQVAELVVTVPKRPSRTVGKRPPKKLVVVPRSKGSDQ